MSIIITPTAGAADPVRRASPWLVLAICCMSLLIVGMDVTIVNVALPSIRLDLGAAVSALQWTTAGYTMALASLLMLGGSTADRLGRARVFKFGAVNPPITNAAVSGMPPSQAGVAAAVATTSRQVGLTLGVALIGALATARADGSLQDHLATACHLAWWLIAVMGAGIVAVGLAASTAAAEYSAERTAAWLHEAQEA